MNNNDRRVKRTRKLLKNALIELTKQKNYESITIRDITDCADIGYATFFRHFEGKDDLMLDIFTGIIEDLEAVPGEHNRDYFEQEGKLLFEHASENKSLYRCILDSKIFSGKLSEHIRDMVLRHLESHQDQFNASDIPLDAAAQHMVSSTLGLMDWWLMHKKPYSIDKMALIYEKLVIKSTWSALGANL